MKNKSFHSSSSHSFNSLSLFGRLPVSQVLAVNLISSQTPSSLPLAERLSVAAAVCSCFDLICFCFLSFPLSFCLSPPLILSLQPVCLFPFRLMLLFVFYPFTILRSCTGHLLLFLNLSVFPFFSSVFSSASGPGSKEVHVLSVSETSKMFYI